MFRFVIYLSFLTLPLSNIIFAGQDSVYVEIIADTVKIWNIGAWENCCISVVTTAEVINDSIFVLEHDTSTMYCRCMCMFDFCISLTGLLNGNYRVFVYRKYTFFTPDSLYFIDSTSFTYGGNGSGILKYNNFQSDCYNPPVEVKTDGVSLPTNFKLEQNYPNPFNPSTVIKYQLPIDGWVTLKIYNILGQEVTTLVDEMQDAGYKSIPWNAEKYPSGIYYAKMKAEGFMDVKKVVLVK